MIRVILVDDEPFLLQMLESSIAWEQYGMSIIGTFYNGKQALEYIRENEVDAVICDIMMPVMDGMALLRELKRMDYPAEFVVLSAYRDFELVRDFFRVGIFDYLTKIDIDSPQTAEVLSRLSLEIKMKKSAGNTEQPLASRLRMLLQEAEGREQERVRLMLLRIVNKSYLSEFNAFIGRFSTERKYNTGQGEAIFLFADQQASQRKMEQIADEMKRMPYRILGGSSTADYPERMEVLLEEAEKAVNYSFYSDEPVISYVDIPARESNVQALEPVALDMCRHYIKNNLSQGDRNNVRDKILDVLEAYRKWNMPYSELKEGIRELLLYLNYQLRDAGMPESVLEEKTENVFALLEENDEYNKLKSLLREHLQMLCSIDPQSGTEGLVERIRLYIDANYDKELDLKSIARKFGISGNYLSRIFVKENGITFKRYVNALKIDKAKEYLGGTALRIGEICERLGYHNVEHFSRLFKDETGFSPSEYRNMGKNENMAKVTK